MVDEAEEKPKIVGEEKAPAEPAYTQAPPTAYAPPPPRELIISKKSFYS